MVKVLSADRSPPPASGDVVEMSRAFGGLPDAVPDRAAVIVPAEKFPEASRRTVADAVLELVAALASNSAA
jgi:hypothetical protein